MGPKPLQGVRAKHRTGESYNIQVRDLSRRQSQRWSWRQVTCSGKGAAPRAGLKSGWLSYAQRTDLQI